MPLAIEPTHNRILNYHPQSTMALHTSQQQFNDFMLVAQQAFLGTTATNSRRTT